MADEVERDLWLLTGRLTSWDEVDDLGKLRDRLSRRGWSGHVACLGGPGSPSALAEREVFAVGALDSPWQRPWAVRRLRRWSPEGSKGNKPALLHILRPRAAEVGLALAESWRVPYLITVNEFLPEGWRLRLSRRWCRGLIAASQDIADDLVRGFGVPEALVRVVPPGMEAIPAAGAGEAPEAPGVPVIGTAGPLTAASGVATFLNAARRVLDAGVDAEFVIAGHDYDGGGEGEIRRRAEKLRLDDRVTLALDPALRPTFWRVLDIYCQPSHLPTMGMPLLRAMARGLPVVASGIPSLSTHIDDAGAGRLVPPGQSEPLAEAILELLSARERAREIGANAQSLVVAMHDPEREADTLADCYRAALDDN